MIDSLNELAEHTRQVAERFPRLAKRVVLRPSSVTPEELTRLRTSWGGLPESYCRCLQTLDLTGIAVGFFEVSPMIQSGETIVDALVRVKEESPSENALQGLVVVGAYEGDPLLLAVQDGEHAGEVLRQDLGSAARPRLTRVANTFEQLLIGAGRLDQMVNDGVEGWLPVEDFLEALAPFQLDDEQLENWRFFAETALVGA